MTREDFGEVVARVKELWPSPAFHRDWNEANRTIAFKKLSTFAQHEVLDCLENHRYDNPDAREPKFSEVAAKLWNVKKSRTERSDGERVESLPSWPTIQAWLDRKSDADLDHLFSILDQRSSTAAGQHDNLWPFIVSLDRRSGGLATLLWSVEHDYPLTFTRGSDEWHAVMDEYDRSQRRRSVEEQVGRTRIKPLEAYPAEPVRPASP